MSLNYLGEALPTPFMVDRYLVQIFRRQVELSMMIQTRSKGKNKASDAELMLAGMELQILKRKEVLAKRDRAAAVERASKGA